MKPIPLAHSPTTEVRTVPLRLPNSALSNARTPYPGGSREADRGREARSLGPAGRAHDPPRLPARVARSGGGRSPVGANRLRGRGLARSPDQEWIALHASPHRSRTPRPTTASAREQPKPFVFVSERGAPLNPAGFSRMVERAGKAAGLGLKAHAHMLRHACGYALANAGHDTRALQAYLGHRNIQNTVRYSELAPGRFSGFWQD